MCCTIFMLSVLKDLVSDIYIEDISAMKRQVFTCYSGLTWKAIVATFEMQVTKFLGSFLQRPSKLNCFRG